MARREYLIRRFLQSLLVLWAVLTLMFFLFRLAPGDPVALLVGAELPKEAQEQLRAAWGLDQALPVQYGHYLANLLRGDFGRSFYYGVPVWQSIGEPLRNTLVLMVASVLLALAVSIPAGAFLGWRRGRVVERLGIFLPLAVRSTPVFWFGILLLMVFAHWLRLFPVGGMRTPGAPDLPFLSLLVSGDFLRHLFLPFFCTALYLMPEPLMIMRTSTLEVKGEDFLELWKGKGHSDLGVLKRASRNALLPVVSWTSLMASFAFGGQVLIEVVFSWPGLGREIVLAVSRQDYPMAQATFFLMAVVVITMNFVIDLIYGYLDPRIVYD